MLVKSEARKNLPGFQILMFCNCIFFILAKWHRVLGTRKCDLRDINRRSLPFEADLSTFSFDVVYTKHSVKIQEYGIQKHICLQSLSVCFWPFPSQYFNMNSPVCRTFFILLVLIIWVLIKPNNLLSWGLYLSLFSFNTFLLDIDILILWGEKIFCHT